MAASLLILPTLVLGCDSPTAQAEGDTWRLDVLITNHGTGSGSIAVTFSSGSGPDACPPILDTLESCRAFAVQRGAPVASARVTASASPGSTLTTWDCPRLEGDECVFEVARSADGEPALETLHTLDILFDLVVSPRGGR